MKNKTAIILLIIAAVILLLPSADYNIKINESYDTPSFVKQSATVTFGLAENTDGRKIDLSSGYMEILGIETEKTSTGIYKKIDIKVNANNFENQYDDLPLDPTAAFLVYEDGSSKELGSYYYRSPDNPDMRIHGFLIENTGSNCDIITVKFEF